MRKVFLTVVTGIIALTSACHKTHVVKTVGPSSNESSNEHVINKTEKLNWQYWAPGGGGEIQSLYLDPNVKDRFYVMSDMEGLYRSDDKGKSYQLLAADLPQLNVFGLASDPSNSERVYLGTHRMAMRSDNAGENWELIPETLNYPIRLIQVHPNKPEVVIMALSTPDVLDLNLMPQNVPEYQDGVMHPGLVFVSHDRGETFSRAYYDKTKLSSQNVWQLSIDTKLGVTYLASERGLFSSNDDGLTWSKNTLPESFQHALGITVTPNNDFVFGIFAKDQKVSRVFMARADELARNQAVWLDVSELHGFPQKHLSQPGGQQLESDGEMYLNPGQRYARLAVDPRSGKVEYGLENKVRLLMGKTMKHHNSSLFMTEITLNTTHKPIAQWQRIYYEQNQKGWKTSQGADNYIQIDSFAFTPISWGPRSEIILEHGHGISLLDIKAKGFPKSGGETVLYQTAVTENNGTDGITTWANRGFVNTYNGDFATSDNYFVAALSDQGLHESWDGGKSWIRDLKPSPNITASKSVEILKTEPNIVVLGAGYGYGASDIPLGLYAKKLESHSPDDKWVHLAGGVDKWSGVGTENTGGLPSVPKNSQVPGYEEAWNYRIWAMVGDSQKPERLFVGFKGKGIYVCDDVPALMNGTGQDFRKLDLPITELPKTSLVANPLQENSFYAPSGNKVLSYQNGKHQFIAEFDGLVEDIYAWAHAGKTYLTVAAVNPEDKSHNVYLSIDGGTNWQVILDRSTLKKAGVPKWFESASYPIDDPLMPFMGGLAGYKNVVFVPVGSIRNSVGIYEITLKESPDGVATAIRNVTVSQGTRHGYTRVNEGEVQLVNGVPYLIHSTRGAGVVASSLAGY